MRFFIKDGEWCLHTCILGGNSRSFMNFCSNRSCDSCIRGRFNKNLACFLGVGPDINIQAGLALILFNEE